MAILIFVGVNMKIPLIHHWGIDNTLSTRQTKGAKIGSNRVEIAPSEDGEASDSESVDDENQPAAKRSKSGKPTIPPAITCVRSELKADVKAGNNTFDFKLEL